MKKYVLHPATFKLDGGAMFGIIPKPLWQKKITPDDNNRILMSLRVVLLDLGDRKVLIDTGIGDYHDEKFQKNFDINGDQEPLLNILKNHFDLNAENITDIILTHLHFDHVGGLGGGIDGTKVQFPNATLHLHQKHYDYALNPTARDQGSFQTHFFKPLLEYYINHGKVNFLNDESGTIIKTNVETISYVISRGHTPYMIHPIFDNYIYMADLVPMDHHVKVPWVMGYDIEPGVTTQYKENIYKLIIDKDLKMIYEHDNETICANLEKDDKGSFVSCNQVKKTEAIQELN